MKQMKFQEIKFQMQSNDDKIEKEELVEEIIIPPEKRVEILTN